MAAGGPFRGLAPFDESARDAFFGRTAEREALVKMVLAERFRIGLVTGPPGVGKTSLVRAGLIPQLSLRGALAVYLTQYEDLERDLVKALAKATGEGATDAASMLAQLCASQPQGAVVIFDHIGDALARDSRGQLVSYHAEQAQAAAAGPGPSALVDTLSDFMTRVARAAGERARFLLCVEADRLFWLGALEQRLGMSIPPQAKYALQPLSTRGASEVIERTVLAGGTYFEDGLSAVIASDLTNDGPVPPIKLQIVCKTAIEQRATTQSRYRAAGGATALELAFIDVPVQAAGGEPGLRVLSALMATTGRQTLPLAELALEAGLSPAGAERAAAALLAGGVLRKERGDGAGERFGLAHEAIMPLVRDYIGGLRQKMVQARLALQRRLAQGSWLRPRELRLVRRYGGVQLSPEGEKLVRKSVRLFWMAGTSTLLAVIALFGLLYMRAANSYEAQLEDGRVVVRLSRPSGLLSWMPHRPAFGAVLGDTGIPATSLTEEARAELTKGKSGLYADQAEPTWLGDVLKNLKPVLRGMALAVSGRPGGYSILKETFHDPAQRRDVLVALAAAGRGEKDEGEILMAALADESPELRRRAVEVAAAIDARRPGVHEEVLRAALRDKTPQVARAVVRESAQLSPSEAAELLATALTVSQSIELRRAAVDAAETLAARDVAAAAEAVRPAAADTDATTRRAALALLEKLLVQSADKVQPVLEKVAADESAREEARISALVALRRAPGVAPNGLAEALERAAAAQSEKLRAAALPLYARVGDPQKALALTTTAQTGSPALRAAAAAAYGALAPRKVDVAAALRALTADSNVDVRMEATRSLAFLGKDGLTLLEKAAGDGSVDVERAAVEALGGLGKANAYGAAGVLEKIIKNGRSSLRRAALEAMGKIGEVKPSAATTTLAKAIKEKDPQLRQSAVTGFCDVGKKVPQQVVPYLRIALRDEDAGVKARVAECMGKDKALGARLASALASDPDPSLRAAAAAATTDGAPLTQMINDKDRGVRLAALKSAAAAKSLREPEKVLQAALAGADNEEKRAILEVAKAVKAAAPVRIVAADADAGLRAAAAQAAAQLGDRGAGVLAALLDDREPPVRVAAMQAIAAAGAGGATQTALERLARTGTVEERQAALEALPPDASARLIAETLDLRSESLRAAAARAAGKLAAADPMRAAPLLERALADTGYDVRRAATPGLAVAYAQTLAPADIAVKLAKTEDRAAMRTALLEALARQSAGGVKADDARRVLERLAQTGTPLVKFGAELVRGFGGDPNALDAFLAQVAGG